MVRGRSPGQCGQCFVSPPVCGCRLFAAAVTKQQPAIQADQLLRGTMHVPAGIIGSMTVQPVAATERAVMYRERAAGM